MNTIRTSDESREIEKQLTEIFQRKTSEEIISEKILDIRSLVASVSAINGDDIFITGKKKRHGKLNIETFLKK